MTSDPTRTARELLTFYVEAGVDSPLNDTTINRFEDSPAQSAGEPQPQRAAALKAAPHEIPPMDRNGRTLAPTQGNTPQPPERAVMAARDMAKNAATLEDLRAMLQGFEGCALKFTAKQLVFADGNPQARLMFVGEAPGRDEDIEGLPFVGRSGQLLDRMIKAIGLDRSSIYIANIIPWRPPGNRTPTPQEAAICLPFIRRQIELCDPDVLVCLGGPSAQTLLETKDGILKTRGRWFTFQTGRRDIRAIATLHPAYLLRQPLQKRLAWRDFLAIRKALTAH